MEVKQNYPLKNLNTFGIEAFAKYFAEPQSAQELFELLKDNVYKNEKKLVLGGGSNMLFISNFDGLLLHPCLKGIEKVEETSTEIIVKAMAGENWDSFVEWTVENGLCGIENLSLIPGTVGASPVQNIGAYGVEIGDCIVKVEAVNIESLETKTFTNSECNFGYRNSIFKNQLKNQYIIVAVYFKLSKALNLKTNYGAVAEELKKIGRSDLKSIRKAIINIRESKLPNPEKIPNAGSFFKNPVVTEKKAESLKNKYPEISMYKAENNMIKIAAGWMIDYLGWKGKTMGNAAVHDKQALVLINKNNAKGSEILNLATAIKNDVLINFGVELEFEVNIIP